VSIHLPPAEVLSARIDSAKTRVYSRETGLFSSPDPNLESEVRAEAERELQQDALQDGIFNCRCKHIPARFAEKYPVASVWIEPTWHSCRERRAKKYRIYLGQLKEPTAERFLFARITVHSIIAGR